MQFVHAWVLFLLIPLPVSGALWYGLILRKRHRLERHFDPELGKRFLVPLPHVRLGAQGCFLLLGLILAVIALARPRRDTAPRAVMEPQHDLVVTLDVSRSMLARDVIPNRLERAKAMVYDLILAGAGRRMALVAFRDGAQRISPLTRDTDFLLQSLDGIDIDSAPPGPTDLAAAIRASMAAFDPDRTGSRCVLLISDGEDLAGELDAALEEARHGGIRFITLGIGTLAGAPIPDERSPTGYQKHEGTRIVTRQVHETLERIAAETGGHYIPAADTMVDIHAMLRQFPPPVTPDPQIEIEVERPAELSAWFLSAALVFLLATVFLSRGRPATGGHGTVAILALWFGAANHGYGHEAPAALPSPPRPARQAIEDYRSGAYRVAAERFEAAAAREPEASLRRALRYNAGCARYHAGDYETAAQLFRNLLDRHPDPPAYVRHDFALAELAAARGALSAVTTVTEISGIRQRIQHAVAQLEKALRERPRQKNWHVTALHLDRTLARAKTIEYALQLAADSADWTPSDLIDDLLERQRAIQRDLTLAQRLPLPQRLRQQQKLVAPQRAVAGRASMLSKIIDRDTVNESLIQKALETTHSAIDWIADADDRAHATVREAVIALEAIRQDLSVPEEIPDPEPPATLPDRPDDLPDAVTPSDPQPDLTDRIEDPRDPAEPTNDERPAIETWEPDWKEGILEKIRRRERHYLEERRRRAIQPAPRDRDW